MNQVAIVRLRVDMCMHGFSPKRSPPPHGRQAGSRTAELPLEDGGWDAVWGWSRGLDLPNTRTWMDINTIHVYLISDSRGLDVFGV